MKLAILGTVGVPAQYGGFETLAENLICYTQRHPELGTELTVYCSGRNYPQRASTYRGARLRYSMFAANGIQSVAYDILTAINAAIRGHDRLLILGISGAMVIPFLRLFTQSRVVINLDGIEWRRNKWQGFARRFLRWSEALAVKYSHQIIADNQGISDYLLETYGVAAEVIPYGGDHALDAGDASSKMGFALPEDFALALCRIEPENNVEMILEAFAETSAPLVFVGNWSNSEYGNALRSRFAARPNLTLLDPIYDPAKLHFIRCRAKAYVHGHSAGGTNPSLVEMMHVGGTILAYDCDFNRYTTEDQASFFLNAKELKALVGHLESIKNGATMKKIANRLYRWDDIGARYFSLLQGES